MCSLVVQLSSLHAIKLQRCPYHQVMVPVQVPKLSETAGRTEKAASALDMAFRSNVPNKHGCDSTCTALQSQAACTRFPLCFLWPVQHVLHAHHNRNTACTIIARSHHIMPYVPQHSSSRDMHHQCQGWRCVTAPTRK